MSIVDIVGIEEAVLEAHYALRAVESEYEHLVRLAECSLPELYSAESERTIDRMVKATDELAERMATFLAARLPDPLRQQVRSIMRRSIDWNENLHQLRANRDTVFEKNE
jgi:hypothetical protein